MGRCTGWKAALALIAASTALVAGGCGSSGGGTRTHAGTPMEAAAAEGSTTSVVVTGCPAAQPRGVVPSPKEWIVDVRVCAARDGSTLLLTNTSQVAVLQIRAASGTRLQEQSNESGGDATSLVDQTAGRVASDGCLSEQGCTLLPGHAILAMGSPATIDFGLVGTSTVAVSAARSYAAWTQEETSNGQHVADRIVTCAKLAGAALPHARSWEEAYDRTYRRGSFCWRLVTTVMGDAGTGERPIIQVFQDIARRIDQGAWSDAMRYGFAHVAAR